MSILDPSSTFDDDFPEFDLHHHHHFPPTSHDLPLASDLDLDLDLELDFSVDDLLLPSSSPSDDEADPPQHPDPHPPSPESANSAVINHSMAEAKDHGRTTLKRKAEMEGDVSPNPRIFKVRCSSSADADEGNSSESTFTLGGGGGGGSEEEEKRKARLMRNRESAQLSRQRKKHYVEELEDKVRAMSSTIADLNGKISFYMSENARLHHQLTGSSAAAANPTLPPTAAAAPAFPPPPLPMHFPWIPYAGYPHHPMRPNGAPVPLVPIPRLKPHQPAPAAKSKKSESRRTSGGGSEGKGRTKKVASVSLLGVLIFMFLVFGGVHYLGRDASLSGKGRVFSVSGGGGRSYKGLNSSTEAKQNSSESIPALLYVPRNGRHVEINGNLIIHSVLASERAMAEAKSGKQKSEGKEGTGLAIPLRSVASAALAVPESERGLGRHPKAYLNAAERVRALGSKPDALKSTPADGPLQQWFREGLAGPILSSGTCTEVFQFEVSPSSASTSGGIVSATSVVNATDKLPPGKMKNRRILYPQAIPLTGSNINDTQHFGKPSENKSNLHINSTVPSMVVSVMADPREAGDGDGDGMITPKSLSRIFVVVLMDSVKYVTYSCVLPLKSYGPHLVN
ncbi:bZIP transcription factor 39-like [Iris pallida]|uniref:BZIP transcription factor 39-like n=1 Tax=Iris pallida TaxID=29817 RepID=A0AAX6GBH3_IRIPA|nr:bZIP transcription factor 39-like [Iris pallida]